MTLLSLASSSAGLGSCVLGFIYFWGLWQTWPLPTLPALADLGPCGHCPRGLALPLPRVQESRLCPIHLVLIPDSHAHGPLLPSSPRPALLITVSFHPSPSLQPFALTPWTSQSSLEPLGSWLQPHCSSLTAHPLSVCSLVQTKAPIYTLKRPSLQDNPGACNRCTAQSALAGPV